MGSVIVDVRVRGSGGEVLLKALVNTGFYGGVIASPDKVEGLGIEFKYERVRRLSNGEAIKIRYGVGEVEIMGGVW